MVGCVFWELDPEKIFETKRGSDRTLSDHVTCCIYYIYFQTVVFRARPRIVLSAVESEIDRAITRSSADANLWFA